jgi:hypothetical protein
MIPWHVGDPGGRKSVYQLRSRTFVLLQVMFKGTLGSASASACIRELTSSWIARESFQPTRLMRENLSASHTCEIQGEFLVCRLD